VAVRCRRIVGQLVHTITIDPFAYEIRRRGRLLYALAI